MSTKKEDEVRYMLKESNAIEGVYDRLALIQAHRAWKYVMQFSELTTDIIKETHRILMVGQPLDQRHRGKWRDVPVWIGGEKKSQPPLVIQREMEKWCESTNTVDRNYDPVNLHVKFEKIHPFVDGNGRMGRILLNWHLVKKNNCPLLVYTEKEKHVYYRLFNPWYPKTPDEIADIVKAMAELRKMNVENL